MLNKYWDRVICDKKCWYDTWSEKKTRMDKQTFELVYDSVKEQIDRYTHDENSTTSGIRNEKNLKNEFKNLINELKIIDNYCSSKSFKPNYSMPCTRTNLKFYNYPKLTSGVENHLKYFGETCAELCGDSANDLENASPYLIHTVNMEKIALLWGDMIEDADLQKEFPNLLKAIWLHYVVLTKYASTHKNQEFEETFKYHTICPYLGAEMLAELKDPLSLTDIDIPILKTLIFYYSRIAPLTGNPEKIECGGTMKIVDSLEGVTDGLSFYPYFITVTIIRLIDSIDCQWNRCGQDRQDLIGRLTKLLGETHTPKEELLHFFKHAYFDVNLDDGYRKEVVYVADFHSPMFLILWAFAKVIEGIEKELKKIDQEDVIDKVREEWGKLTTKQADGNLEIGFLKLREGKFDVDVSLAGMLTDFSKEGWWEDGYWSMFKYEKPTEQISELEKGKGGKRTEGRPSVQRESEKKVGEQKKPEVGLPIPDAKGDIDKFTVSVANSREVEWPENSHSPKTQIVPISDTQKEIVRIAVAQFCFELTESFPFVLKNKDDVKTKVFSALDIAKQDGADIVCLPELCLCEEWISEIKEKYANMIIIGGSFYKDNKNFCPVIIESDVDVPYQPKITPSDLEIPRMVSGDTFYIYKTQFGRFMVLICRDFYNLAHYYRTTDVDMIFCPSYNSADESFQTEAHAHVEKVPSYILIANTGKYGGTSIFGQLHKKHLSSLVDDGCKDAEEVKSNKLAYKLCEVKKRQEEMIVADFNLIHKSVQIPTPADPKEEIRSVGHPKKISIGCCSGSIGDISKKPTESVVGDETDNEPVGEFGVYIAYNSKDVEQVTDLSKLLEGRGLNPWLDTEQVLPGRRFQDTIQQVILKAKSAAVIIGKEGIGKWQKRELDSFISQCVENDIPVIPVLLPGVSKIPSELLFLKELSLVRFIDKIDEQKALDNLEWGIKGKHPQRKPKGKQ